MFPLTTLLFDHHFCVSLNGMLYCCVLCHSPAKFFIVVLMLYLR